MGGTNIKFGVVSEKGELISKEKYATQQIKASDKAVNSFIDKIGEQLNKYPHIKKIGIGLPGMLSKNRQKIYELANIPEFNAVLLGKKLKEHFPNKIFHLENDAAAAALGEYHFSKKKLPDSFLFITLGTGIGGGLIIDGKIFKGGDGNGVEIGHIIAGNGKTVEQNIGKQGIITLASQKMAKTNEKSVLRNYKTLDVQKITKAILKEDPIALKIYDQLGLVLGELITSSVRMFDISTILIGGGVSKTFKYLEKSMYEKVRDFLPEYYLEKLHIKKATLGNNAGIIGAASLCFINQKLKKV